MAHHIITNHTSDEGETHPQTLLGHFLADYMTKATPKPTHDVIAHMKWVSRISRPLCLLFIMSLNNFPATPWRGGDIISKASPLSRSRVHLVCVFSLMQISLVFSH